MFYFPITTFHLPDWFPIMGGEGFLFFSPIFNFADAAITTGVFTILLFQRRFFDEHPQLEKRNSDAHSVPTQDTKIADVENRLNEPKETTEHE
jgi:signal peptidase II